jgi:WD40 repeat protein
LAKRVVVDHRTDIYSLGATLYELLTLEPAFGGADRQELLRQIAFEEPKAPRRVNKAIPAELETIALKAMEKNPSERYATAKELAEDLRRWLTEEPIRAKRPGPVLRLRKWAIRHRRAVVFAAAVLGLAVMALAASTIYAATAYRAEKEERQKAQEAEHKAEHAEGKERQQREDAEKKRDQAELRAYVADMRLARQLWEGSEISNLKYLLDKHRPREGRPDWRGWEWYYLQTLCHSDLVTFDEDKTQRSADQGAPLIWSSSGLLAWGGAKDGTVWLWDTIPGHKPVALTEHCTQATQVDFLAWSPDGRRLASIGTNRDMAPVGPQISGRTLNPNTDSVVRVWDGQTHQVIGTLSTPRRLGDYYSLAWSPDSRRIAVSKYSTTGQVTVWDPEAGKDGYSVGGDPRNTGGESRRDKVAWNCDGTRLAITDAYINCEVCDAATGKKVLTVPSEFKSSGA